MTAAFQILLDSITRAFQTMANWEIFPGVSLLAFFISLIVLQTLLHVLWININTSDKGDKGGK